MRNVGVVIVMAGVERASEGGVLLRSLRDTEGGAPRILTLRAPFMLVSLLNFIQCL